jgi:hypothetical protein
MIYSKHPEFHPNGTILRVSHPEDLTIFVDIKREGSALVFYDPSGGFDEVVVLRTPEDFKKAFPHGEIPDADCIEWEHNAWFDLYCGEDGTHMDVVSHSLDEALISAYLMVDTVYRNTCR